MKVTYTLLLVAGLAIGSCRDERAGEVAVSDSLARDLELPDVDTMAPEPVAAPSEGARDTAPSERRRTAAGARAPVPAPPRSASRPKQSRPRTAARSVTEDSSAPTTTAYAPGAAGADTAPLRADAADTGVSRPSETSSAPPAKVDTAPPARDVTAPRPADTAARRPSDTAARPPSDTTTRPPSDTATRLPADTATPSAPAASNQPTPVPATPSTPEPSESVGDTVGVPAATGDANTLPAGTQFRIMLQDTINSLRNSEGQTVTGRVSGDIRTRDGRTVFPSGSTVYVRIARLRPARTRSARDGELELRVDSVMVSGHSYAVNAEVGPVPHELRGRGVTAGEVEKVGVGAAAGAVVGGVVTGKTKGAVIGGVIGAAGGTVVAAQTASRDVVVAPGTQLTVILQEPVTRAGR